jgi:uncharacterized LabA/DUF88 family protein
MQKLLFIDGRNFIGKLKEVLGTEGYTKDQISEELWPRFNFRRLLETALGGAHIAEVQFYFGRLREHEQTLEKSRYLIQQQRLLKTHLEHSGYRVNLVGAVRANSITDAYGNETLVFKEKGADVSIAVDMVLLACAGAMSTAILASSDSDMQPVVQALKEKHVETTYLGFEIAPNKGLTATCSRTILIRNSEVVGCMPQELPIRSNT